MATDSKKTTSINLRLDAGTLEAIRKMALAQGVGYQILIKWHLRDLAQTSNIDLAKWPHLEGSHVYFLQCEDAVKIGYSASFRNRVSALQLANARELILVLAFPGGEVEEHALHARFAASRIRGEWFRISPEIENFIESHPGATPLQRLPSNETIVNSRWETRARELIWEEIAAAKKRGEWPLTAEESASLMIATRDRLASGGMATVLPPIVLPPGITDDLDLSELDL